MAKLRCTGTVLDRRTDRREYDGEVRETEQLRVLVGKSDVETVKFSDRYPVAIPAEGDEVDLLVLASPWSGRNGAGLSITALEPYPVPAQLSAVREA